MSMKSFVSIETKSENRFSSNKEMQFPDSTGDYRKLEPRPIGLTSGKKKKTGYRNETV